MVIVPVVFIVVSDFMVPPAEKVRLPVGVLVSLYVPIVTELEKFTFPEVRLNFVRARGFEIVRVFPADSFAFTEE